MMLVLLLNGLLEGTRKQVTVYLDNSPGKLVVMQQGVNSLAAASSLLPLGSAEAARQIPGVKQVIPVLSQSTFFDLHGKKIFAYLIGYDPALGGGPWQLAAGREPQRDREVVVDETLARLHNIQLGDDIEVGGVQFFRGGSFSRY